MWNEDIVRRLATAGAATVYEAYGRKGNLDPTVSRISSSRQIAGPAFCVVCTRGDNLALHRAVAEAQEGDILVVAGHGDCCGYLGDILAEAAVVRGIAGIVVDGFVRDRAELQKLDFPVWARGLSIKGATKTSPGQIGIAMDCAGVRIEQGDLIVADDDGVTCVAKSDVATVVGSVQQRLEQEMDIRSKLRQGALTLDLLDLREKC